MANFAESFVIVQAEFFFVTCYLTGRKHGLLFVSVV